MSSNNVDMMNTSQNNQSNNVSMDYGDNFAFQPSQKIKLDEILDALKRIKVDSSTIDELRSAIKLLRRFKMVESSKWCSELLISITEQNNLGSNTMQDTEKVIQRKNLSNLFNKANISNQKANQSGNPTSPFIMGNKYSLLYQQYKNDESGIKDILAYASSLLELKEYIKCSHLLSNYALPKYPTAMFIYFYCEYLIIQQKMQEEQLDNNDMSTYKYSNSSELNKLQMNIARYEQNFSPFMMYLYGIILKDLKRFNEAKTYFIKSLSQFPFMWSCWVELSLISKISDFKNIFCEIEDHWMKFFYLANFLIEKNNESESITVLNSLIPLFPNSFFLLNSLAHAYYLLHEYETSLEYFEKLFQLDPHRYENLDTYSNILFIKENYCELSNLAYKCYQNDKYRPETCCVIGNYYALKGDHPKAVAYFKRATKLDYSFLPAWTLMGHEYLEMKIISAAIESYRTAVDIDPNDYRAWYGLGQTYEIHQMYNFAIYYFINAAKAKPNDSRMWTAIGLCYEKLDKKQEAIKCYEKAIFCKDREGIALYKMAKLYNAIGDIDKAAICFKENLCRNVNEEIDTDEMIESCLFLAKYYKNKGDLDDAYNILLKLKDYEGTEKDEIHSIMREIINLKGSNNTMNGSFS